MFQCKVINPWSVQSVYVVEFPTRREAHAFARRKEAEEYVDRVEITHPSFLSIVWKWFENFV
jgi:hypothetical protein